MKEIEAPAQGESRGNSYSLDLRQKRASPRLYQERAIGGILPHFGPKSPVSC